MRGTTAVEDPDHGPISFSEKHGVADIGLRKTVVNRFADHNFPLSRSEPAARDNLYLLPHLQAPRRQRPHGDIGFAGAIFPGKHDHQNVFTGYQSVSLTVFRNAWEILKRLH